MALTPIQREVCSILAARRRLTGESYVAGGIAINVLLAGHRYSRDIDLFHDSNTALAASWKADRTVLVQQGFQVTVDREDVYFVSATVERDGESVIVDWAHDSPFRFFPLIEHEQLGLSLHPFDLATNKVLALEGRLEPRDWIDLILCCDSLQPLGYLVWAASGKDEGLSPSYLLTAARRSSRYTQIELDKLRFDGDPANAAALSIKWRAMLEEADKIVARLPADHVGEAVLDSQNNLLTADPVRLEGLLSTDSVRYHSGSIKGAFPILREYDGRIIR